jgi:hypothetical protein
MPGTSLRRRILVYLDIDGQLIGLATGGGASREDGSNVGDAEGRALWVGDAPVQA